MRNPSVSDDVWQSLSPAEKKKQLYRNQKQLLGTFLERGAITRAQYEKSLGDLTRKMGVAPEESEEAI